MRMGTRTEHILGIGGDEGEGEGNAGTIAGAAAGTALAPGVGTAVGAALGKLIGSIFGGGGSTWDNAAPGVKELLTGSDDTFPDGAAFEAWLRSKHPDAFGSTDMLFAMWPLFLKGKYNSLVRPDEKAYRADITPRAYAAMGIDYERTLMNTPRGAVPSWTALPGQGSTDVPQNAVDEAKDAAARIAAGNPQPGDVDLLAAINKAAGDLARAVAGGAAQGANDAGGIQVQGSLDMRTMLPWILGGLLLLVAVIVIVRKAPAK